MLNVHRRSNTNTGKGKDAVEANEKKGADSDAKDVNTPEKQKKAMHSDSQSFCQHY